MALNSQGRTQANMGVAVGDVDGDGLFDLFVTHLTDETNALWVQKPRGWFQDQTTAAGLTAPTWPGTGWGTVLADFDHDGDADLALVNGRVIAPGSRSPGSPSRGGGTPSATNSSPTTGPGGSATSRPRTPRSAARRASPAA